MFPKTDNLHVFKPKNIYRTTGSGIIQKLGKSGIKTISKLVKKKIINKKSAKKSGKKQQNKKKILRRIHHLKRRKSQKKALLGIFSLRYHFETGHRAVNTYDGF